MATLVLGGMGLLAAFSLVMAVLQLVQYLRERHGYYSHLAPTERGVKVRTG